MKSFSIPYRSELIAIAMIVVFLVVIKNRFQYVQAAVATVEAGKRTVEERKSLSSRWTSVDKDFTESMQGFLLKGPVNCKNIIQDKAWANNINLIDMRSGQDMSGVLGVGSLDLTMSGEYKDTVKFINALEENSLRIMNLEITGTDRKKQVGMKVYCYFAKDNENG